MSRQTRGIVGTFVMAVAGFLAGTFTKTVLGISYQSLLIALAAAVCVMAPVFIGTMLWADRAVR